MMPTPAVVRVKTVAAAICLNAAVWDAVAVILYHRSYTLFGVSAAFMSAAFQCVALTSVQPHILAVVNGCGVFAALYLDAKTRKAHLSPAIKAAAVIMVVSGATGMIGIRPPPPASNLKQKLGLVIAAAYLIAAVAILPPALVWARRGYQLIRCTKRRWLLPVADAANATAFTACLALVAASDAGWPLLALPVAGAITLTSSVASLKVNTVRDHVCISYVGWCTGLLALDASGGYSVNMVLLVVQLTGFAVALTIVLRPAQ